MSAEPQSLRELLVWGARRLKDNIWVPNPAIVYDRNGISYNAYDPICVQGIQVFFYSENDDAWKCDGKLVEKNPVLSGYPGVHLRTSMDLECLWPDFNAYIAFCDIFKSQLSGKWIVLEGGKGVMPQERQPVLKNFGKEQQIFDFMKYTSNRMKGMLFTHIMFKCLH